MKLNRLSDVPAGGAVEGRASIADTRRSRTRRLVHVRSLMSLSQRGKWLKIVVLTAAAFLTELLRSMAPDAAGPTQLPLSMLLPGTLKQHCGDRHQACRMT